MRHQTSTFSCATLLAAFLAITTGAVARDASKQDSSKAVPANARANQFGSGWECKPGFRQEGVACAAIKLPENAYLSDDSFGPGWACKREYKSVGNGCVAVKLPQNAYFPDSSYSNDWECERGFRQAGAACVSVTVPKNGYLSDASSGRGWDCESRLSRNRRSLRRREGAAERLSLGFTVRKRLAVRTRFQPIRSGLRGP